MDIIEIKDGQFYYDESENQILKDINVKIGKSEKIALIGANGTGKSTLMHILNASEILTSGKILIEGMEIKTKKDDLRSVRKKVALVFQNPEDQFIAPTVREEISFGLYNLKLEEEEIESTIEKIASDLEIDDLLNKNLYELSGGQKKIVAIASTLVMQPEIFLLDEPTANLDEDSIQKFYRVLGKLEKKGLTIIISSHDMDFVWDWADRIILMKDGQISYDGNRDILVTDIYGSIRKPRLLEFVDYLNKKGYNIERKTRRLEEIDL